MKKTFAPLFEPSPVPLPSQAKVAASKKIFGPLDAPSIVFIRDQLSLSTWLSLGALLQGAALLLVGPYALLPAALLILTRLTTAYLQTVNVLSNPSMTDVIPQRISGQSPSASGTFNSGPSSSTVVIFLIGARSNHPLGALAPNFARIGSYFSSLRADVEARASEYSFLGGSTWMSNERTTSNAIMNVMYFSSVEGLHKFAHDIAHREAWSWWNENGAAKMPYATIFHEMFESRQGQWESIYVNSALSGMAATTWEREVDGKKVWVRAAVDAKGVLGSARGRLGIGREGRQVAVDGDDYSEEERAVA